ncbi:hypothetical protein GCM10022388_13800 [Flavobacterium chungnamense]|uniref:Uncharacterized protein n=1 Tax=Flavobacterium chungnamense TaxID=706182 RepID=A0ABP7UPI5_9FLAO
MPHSSFRFFLRYKLIWGLLYSQGIKGVIRIKYEKKQLYIAAFLIIMQFLMSFKIDINISKPIKK